jgi:hypothetical protein
MHAIKPLLVLAGIVGLMLAALALIVLDVAMYPRREEQSADFQRLTGGLGFGPSLSLESCPHSFDPRLDPGGVNEEIPFGPAPFCPQPGGSIFYYPPLRDPRFAAED